MGTLKDLPEGRFTFINDKDKIRDFLILSKSEFLKSYSYIRETEYERTRKEILKAIDTYNEIIN